MHNLKISPRQPSLVTGSLHSLLLGMIEESVDERVTLEQLLSFSQHHIEGSAQEEVDRLVDYILGPSHDVMHIASICDAC